MNRVLIAVFAAAFAGFIMYGCDNTNNERVEPSVVGVEPVEVNFIEQTSYDLPVWLSGDAQGRILVRLSAFDGLSPVAPDNLEELKAMAAGLRYQEMLSAGNVMNPDALYTSANAVYLAHELEVADEVIWVVPGFQSMTEEDLVSIRGNLTEILPQASADIQTLTLREGVITGTVMGIPLTMLALPDLEAPGEPVLLSIDASFMFALYDDEKTTPSLPFIAGMFKILGEAGLKADYVGLSASNQDRRCPYNLRSMARYLSQMLEEPSIAAGKPPKLWEERALAWKAGQQDVEIAIPIYRNIIENYPDDAATRYDLAEAYFRLDRLTDAGTTLAEAVRLDYGYRGAFSGFAGRLAEDGRKKDADMFFGMMPDPITPAS